MSLWHKHTLLAPKLEYQEDEREEEVKSFEDQVLGKLALIASRLEKLENRMERLEEKESFRIDRLESDLRKKGDYIETLLAKLLDKDYVVGAISKSGTNNISKPVEKYESKYSGNGGKLAGPVGKLP